MTLFGALTTALRAVPLPRKRGRNLLRQGRDPVPPLRSGGGGPPEGGGGGAFRASACREAVLMRAPSKTIARARRLRRTTTLPEGLLWRVLRGAHLANLRFRRQHPVGPYILDFYCPSARLAVEVDGAGHDFVQRALQDERRDQWLARQGIRVLRLRAVDVLDDKNPDNVAAAILVAAGVPLVDTHAPSTALRAVPLPRFAGEEPGRVLGEGDSSPVYGGGGPGRPAEGVRMRRPTIRERSP
jgi:very-short-patch-repair endonuclease